MKKSKLSVGLVTAFIGALALSACDTGSTPAVTAKDDVILDFVGYNNETDRIEVRAGTPGDPEKPGIYDEISKTDEGTKLYYDAILETLIRSQYEGLSKNNSELKKFALVKSEANDKVKAAKQTAQDNASSSGTSYDEEWKKILESHDCETEEDLRQYYLFDIEKKEITDWYSKNNIDELKDQYIGIDDEWAPVPETEKVDNVDSVYPYHILHVLVKLSAAKDDYIRGTITQDEANKLWTVVRNLIDGDNNFEQVAKDLSDDTGSATKFGDVGIMSTKTSFYNEFKLGIYAYDALLSRVNQNVKPTEGTATDPVTSNIYEALGLEEDDGTGSWVSKKIVTNTTEEGEVTSNIEDLIQSEMVTNINTPLSSGYSDIPTIPYDVFKQISDVADKEKIGNVSPEAGDVALPRNVLFNKFLNFHSPFIITDEDIELVAGTAAQKFTDETVNVTQHDFSSKAAGNLYIKKTNFSSNALSSSVLGTKKVLTDQNNNVIIGVRSEAGIHFMVMRKSVFYRTNSRAGDLDESRLLISETTHEKTSLQDYYTTLTPSDDEFPSGGQTFVNMSTTSDKTYYTQRADTIKDELKSTSTFDAAFDYRLYEYLMGYVGDKIVFFDEDASGNSEIRNNIDEYIKRLRETKHNGDVDSINQAWQSYLMMLKDQNYKRAYKGAMLPTTCSLKFDSTNKSEFKEGGICYVKK